MTNAKPRSGRTSSWAARLALSVGVGAGTGAASIAWCVPASANDPATATMLFNDARHLAAAGHYAEACPKFEASERLDPGIGTQYNLADCYEHIGRTASAWALFLDVASSAGGTGQEAREKLAHKRAQALEAKVPKLTLRVPAGIAGLHVTRNGETVDAVLWNAPIPVDPGSYVVAAAAPGRKDWSTSATVPAGGATITLAIPELERAAAPAVVTGMRRPSGATAAAAGLATPSDAGAKPVANDARFWGPQRIAAVALGGAGVVSLGVGAVFGLRSFSKHSAYEQDCSMRGDATVCSPAASPLRDDAVSAGNVSTVGFLLAAAFLGGGAALWFTAPHATPSAGSVGLAPMATRDGGGAMIGGRW